MAGLDMPEHLLGFGMAEDSLLADRLKVIDLFDLPALGFGIVPGAFLLMLELPTRCLEGSRPDPL
jgi:hypothetical protein